MDHHSSNKRRILAGLVFLAEGFQVVIHNSATELLGELPPDVNDCLITDLMMPAMTGIELQDALRKSGNPIPIIFLIGHGDIPTSVHAMRSGAEDFLTKNAPKQDLLAAVHRARITTKLGVHSVAEITRMVQQAGIFGPDSNL